jgi:ankyrin repeat protein
VLLGEPAVRAVLDLQDKQGRTALMLTAGCSWTGHAVPIAELLLAAGAKTDIRDNSGATAIHNAIFNPSMITALAKAGVDLDAADDSGRTALHKAAWESSTAAVTALVEAGANVNMRDRSGRTPGEVVEARRVASDPEYDVMRHGRILRVVGHGVNRGVTAAPANQEIAIASTGSETQLRSVSIPIE